MDISKIYLKNATLLEFAQALISAEGDSYRDNYINAFFANVEKRTSLTSESISNYEHRKIQYVWEDFLKKEGWSLIEDCFFSYTAKIPATTFDIETSPGKFIKGYRSACLFYKKQESKMVVEIERDTRGLFYYKITTTENNSLFMQDIKKYASENNLYRGKKIDCMGNFLKLENISWEDLILPEETKNIIRSNIEENFAFRDIFKKFEIPVKRGIILYGMPGTGKTKVCKCLAKDANYSVLYALPSDFPNPSSISTVCEMAKDLAPCLFIIEDIDWIASDRSKGTSAFVMELMNKLDGIESFGDVITLGTTNALGELEQAIKNRPGRFDRVINIDKPNLDCRKKMILKFTEKFSVDKDVNLDKLTLATDGLTGAHINDLCLTASIFAVKGKSFEGEKLLLKKSHFDEAINEVKNKDYSSYMEQQSKNNSFGFGQIMKSSYIEDFLDNDFP